MDGLEGQWALVALTRNRSSRATLRTEPLADADQLQSYKRPSAWLNERPSHTLVYRACWGPWQTCDLPAVPVSWTLSLLRFTLILWAVVDVFELAKLPSKDMCVRNCASVHFVHPVIEVEKRDDFLPIGTMKLVYRHSKRAISHCISIILGKMPRAGKFG